MTKQQEIEVLDNAIRQLGPDSYLGPWLTQLRGEVESAIRSDYFPEITLAQAQQRARDVVEHAKKTALGIVDTAEKESRRIKRASNLYLDEVASAINEAQRAIQRI